MSQDTPEFTVTNGTVKYEHKKPMGEDYDNKQPMVTLHYQIAEGADPALATAKVMGIAMEIVERAIATNVTVTHAALKTAVEAPYGEQKGRRGRPPNTSVPIAATNTPVGQVEKAIDAMGGVEDAASMAGIDSVDEDAELGLVPTEQQVETVNYVTDVELQAQAQKVSGHLRKEFQNINDLRKLIASCQAEGTENGTLLTIPADKRYDFMQKSKGLLAMKK